MSNKFSHKGFSLSILFFVLLVSIYLFLHSSFFNIDKIYVTGLDKVSKSEIYALAGIKKGTNIFEINKEISAKSIQIHPMVKNAQIVRHLPRSIEIHVKERKPWAVIPYNDIFLYVDNEGFCMDKVNNVSIINYPIITLARVPVHVNLGQAVEPVGIKMVKEVWNLLPAASREQISEFHYLDAKKGLIIYTMKGTEVKFGNLERLNEKTKLFQEVFTIEKDFQKSGTDVLEYVDLRYKGQPVIKTRA